MAECFFMHIQAQKVRPDERNSFSLTRSKVGLRLSPHASAACPPHVRCEEDAHMHAKDPFVLQALMTRVGEGIRYWTWNMRHSTSLSVDHHRCVRHPNLSTFYRKITGTISLPKRGHFSCVVPPLAQQYTLTVPIR